MPHALEAPLAEERIVEVLELAKSSYLAPFMKLSQLIEEGRTEAVDNLKFLENLNEPCETLAAASPKEIPDILPKILNVVRLIWRHSRFYNSAERLAGLLLAYAPWRALGLAPIPVRLPFKKSTIDYS